MSMSRCRGSTFPPQSMSTPTIAPRWLFPPMVGTIVCLVVSWLCRVNKKRKKTFSCWLFTSAKIPLGKLMLWVEWPVTRVGYQAGWQHGWIRREAALWRGGGYYFESHFTKIHGHIFTSWFTLYYHRWLLKAPSLKDTKQSSPWKAGLGEYVKSQKRNLKII